MSKGRGRHWLAPILQNWAQNIMLQVQVWTTVQIAALQVRILLAVTLAETKATSALKLATDLLRAEWQLALAMAQQKEAADLREAETRLRDEIRVEVASAEARIRAEVGNDRGRSETRYARGPQ